MSSLELAAADDQSAVELVERLPGTGEGTGYRGGPTVWWLRTRINEGHACGDSDFVLFFGPEGEPNDQRRYRERAAVRVCAGCPVAGECWELAVRNREQYGVWGGLNERELRREIRARDAAAREGAA